MNSNVYVFGKFGKEYTQYPNDYTKNVYQKFLHGASAQSQMIIHRDGDLMYYGYIRHLDTDGHFIGFSVVLNGVMVCNTDVLFEIFEFAVSELISRNEILTLSYDNVLLPCIEQLSEKAEEVERISVIIQDQLVELESDMSRLPTATVGPASNSYIKYKYGDDVSVIAKSSMQYGFTYVCKNFDNISVVNQPTYVISPVYYEGNDDNRTRKWLYGVIVLLLAVIGGGGYWWYSQTEEEREVQEFVERFAKAVELGDNNLLHQLQAQEMPSFLQVMKLWREIDKKIPSYDYSNVKANNFALLSNHINGMKLVHCEVKDTIEYSEPNGGFIPVTIPIICYGINSKVKNITYSSPGSDVKFAATSEHACGIVWSEWEYGQNFAIYIKDKEDAMIFSNEMEMHVGRGREDSLLVSSDDKSISVNGTCYMGNSYPLFKNGWYVFELRLI